MPETTIPYWGNVTRAGVTFPWADGPCRVVFRFLTVREEIALALRVAGSGVVNPRLYEEQLRLARSIESVHDKSVTFGCATEEEEQNAREEWVAAFLDSLKTNLDTAYDKAIAAVTGGPNGELPNFGETRVAIPYWGDLAIVQMGLSWARQRRLAGFQLLDVEQSRLLSERVAHYPVSVRPMAERQLRLALALAAVDGQPVRFVPDDPVADLQAREDWVGDWPGPLLLAVSSAYEQAAAALISTLEEMQADPLFGSEPYPPGASLAPVAPGPASGSPPTSGPSSPPTAKPTRRTRVRKKPPPSSSS